MRDEAFAFQAEIEVRSEEPIVARPNLRGHLNDELDERIADLQYRDVPEFAVGHGVATSAEVESDGRCRHVSTSWIPCARVEWVAPAEIEGVELGMEALAGIESGSEARRKMGRIVETYREWIRSQKRVLPGLTPPRRETAEELLRRANGVADRLQAGLGLLEDP